MMRSSEKLLETQMCLHAPSTRSLLVESKEMAHNAVPSTEVTSVSAVKRQMTQTIERVVMQTQVRNPRIHLLGQNNRVVRSASDFINSTKKNFVVGIPNLISCALNAT